MRRPPLGRILNLGVGAGRVRRHSLLGHQAAVPVTLTLVVGLLLGLTGAWLGSAGRRLAVR